MNVVVVVVVVFFYFTTQQATTPYKGKGILVLRRSRNGHFYPAIRAHNPRGYVLLILCSRRGIEYTLPSCQAMSTVPCTAGDGAEESATSGDRTWDLSIGSQTD